MMRNAASSGVLYPRSNKNVQSIASKNRNLNLTCERVIFLSWKSLRYALAIRQVPGMIKNTGIVRAGFKRYRIEGFKSGIPPMDAMHMKKNMMLINSRQNPIE